MDDDCCSIRGSRRAFVVRGDRRDRKDARGGIGPEGFKRGASDFAELHPVGKKLNAAHRAIADYQWESRTQGRSVTLATQNIDDLHERGGSPQVAHLHGTLFATHCYAGCGYAVAHDVTPYDATPVCPRCGSWLRPSVVLFGEQLDVDAQMAARRAVRECEVSTAANLIRYASDVGALLVTVDPTATVPEIFDVHVQLPAEDALPRILL